MTSNKVYYIEFFFVLEVVAYYLITDVWRAAIYNNTHTFRVHWLGFGFS
jgi:hypothetical protein